MHKATLQRVLIIFLLAGMAQAAGAAATGVYRWVDEEGKVHYSDVPPAEQPQQAERIQVRTTPADPEKAAALAEARKKAADAQAEQEAEARKNAQAAAAEAARRAQKCAMARSNLRQLVNTNRAFEPTADGGRRYYSDAELDARRAKAQARVNEYCR